jgi:hypothetical protein
MCLWKGERDRASEGGRRRRGDLLQTKWVCADSEF